MQGSLAQKSTNIYAQQFFLSLFAMHLCYYSLNVSDSSEYFKYKNWV